MKALIEDLPYFRTPSIMKEFYMLLTLINEAQNLEDLKAKSECLNRYVPNGFKHFTFCRSGSHFWIKQNVRNIQGEMSLSERLVISHEELK